MLRVAHVGCDIDPAGRDPEALLEAWPTLPAVAEATSSAGALVTVVHASAVPARFQRNGVNYHFVETVGRGGPMLSAWRLASAVRKEKPDVVHLNGLDFPLHARLLSANGAPLLVQDHASYAERRLSHLRRWGHRGVSAAAFTSLAQAKPFVRTHQLPGHARIFAIPESSSHFTPGSREHARRLTGVFGDPALLWIGHLNANKDPITILCAVAEALASLPRLELWCAFIGAELLPQVDVLLRSDERLAARTHLIGSVPRGQVETLCRACDLFVSGSHREGSGYALIEAMACGLMPVVSDIPAFRALTADGAIGALVPSGDAHAFARAIVELAGAQHHASRRSVRDHFERNLSFAIVGARLVDAYSQIAGLGRAA
jgi:glycosyltransferase involved in cell wall biosynthesis